MAIGVEVMEDMRGLEDALENIPNAEIASKDIEYRCFICKKRIGRFEPKIVLPSSLFGSSDLPIHLRSACGSCYFKLKNTYTMKNRTRITKKRVTDSQHGRKKLYRITTNK
jgi:hypothetical protein